ncbi:hypothetical protein PLANPX_5116 [Lacipirellula parvula]|uniref:Uncharacterized protein n=1 Tax=Lacipirellula parvula TaxID=2650471 RepID=A0A5K7XF55_9BACT|nr:hypothetical protein PLANPX_5116 [Lacipirellula parvula]
MPAELSAQASQHAEDANRTTFFFAFPLRLRAFARNKKIRKQ